MADTVRSTVIATGVLKYSYLDAVSFCLQEERVKRTTGGIGSKAESRGITFMT